MRGVLTLAVELVADLAPIEEGRLHLWCGIWLAAMTVSLEEPESVDEGAFVLPRLVDADSRDQREHANASPMSLWSRVQIEE